MEDDTSDRVHTESELMAALLRLIIEGDCFLCGDTLIVSSDSDPSAVRRIVSEYLNRG